jgi:acyl-ACP thioesterase
LTDFNQQPGETEPGMAQWGETLRVHSYDVDFRKRATAEAVCRAFLEAAWNHAEHLGFGYQALAKANKLWVLARLFITLDRSPQWGETVQLVTWPRGVSGLFALRDFELYDAGKQRLAAGASSWLVLDAANHRPQRFDRLALPLPTGVSRAAVEREPRKLPPLNAGKATSNAQIRYSDIDVNQHVNSARYIAWLLDSYTKEFHETHELRTIELNYLSETRWNDTISVITQQQAPLQFSHSIVRADGAETCRAELLWAEPPVDTTSRAPNA